MSGAPPGRGRRRPSRVVVLALVFFLSLASGGVALAHANLVRSDPPGGTSLARPPTRVQLWFSEDVEPSFSEAVVYDANRQRVDLGDSHVAPDDPRSLIVGIKPGLPQGTYVVAWKTQSKVDGHIVRGTVPFGVGVAASTPMGAGVVASAAGVEGPVQGPVSGSPGEMALRWLILVAAAVLVGAFAFWLLQADLLDRLLAGEASHDHPIAVVTRSIASTGLLRLQLRAARLAGLGFVLGNVGLLLVQTAAAADVSLGAALGAPLLRELTATQYGELWLARIALAALLGLVLLARGRCQTAVSPRTLDGVGLALGGALLATISLTSHSAAVSTPPPFGVLPVVLIGDWLHLAAVAVWIGGLLQLAIVTRGTAKLGSLPARVRFLGTLVPRFSRLAAVALAVVGVTGLAEALVHVGTLDNLLDTTYGTALVVKLIVIVPLVALGAVNHFVVRPALERVRGAPEGARVASPRVLGEALDRAAALRLTVLLEVALAFGVIAAVGVMTSVSPAVQTATASGSGSLTLTAPAADLGTSFTVAPGRPGPNRYVVEVRTSTGQPVGDVERVTLRFTYLDSDLGVSETTLQPRGAGRFEGQSSDLAVAGRWQVETIVRRPGRDDARVTFGFEVTSGGAQTIQTPRPQLGWLFYLGLLVVIGGGLALARSFSLRQVDLRRSAVVALCGLGLLGTGSYLAFQDVQAAEAQAASQALSLLHPATPESIANGALVYRQNCAMCHGLDARGNGPLAPTLNPRPADLILHVPQHPDADLANWIANGFPGSAMPAFKTTLTEQERWDVLNYLKSLASQNGASGGAVTPASVSPAASPATRVVTTAAPAITPTPSGESATPQGWASPTSIPAASATPSPPGSGLDQRRPVGDLDVALQIQPRVFQPADVDVRLWDRAGQPAAGIERVDLQLAMEGMNHGARGVAATPVGPGHYHARAMLLAMEGDWWLALRVERAGGKIDSAVFRFQVPRDQSNGPVPPMATRPAGPVQIEDVAVYPEEIMPSEIAVTAGHPVRLEVFFVDRPACGSIVRLTDPPAQATATPDGLADLSFAPRQTGRLSLTCSSEGLQIGPAPGGGSDR